MKPVRAGGSFPAADWKEMKQAMAEVELENERLSRLLGAQDTYAALDPVYARVIARDAGEWFDTFSINKGTSDGVIVGMAVVSADGLLGKVYEAGLNYAKVISVIDSRSSVAVQRRQAWRSRPGASSVAGVTTSHSPQSWPRASV